jgi:hypothetical protein
MQSSKVQLWVVKMHNGELQPFELRSATTGGGMLPSASTEQALVMWVTCSCVAGARAKLCAGLLTLLRSTTHQLLHI